MNDRKRKGRTPFIWSNFPHRAPLVIWELVNPMDLAVVWAEQYAATGDQEYRADKHESFNPAVSMITGLV